MAAENDDIDRRPEASVIVVTYDSATTITPCLTAVDSSRDLELEIVVVDNNSGDDTVEVIERDFPHVTLIRSAENLGFARACNLAASRATGRHLLMLNPDTVIQPESIAQSVEYLLENPNVGAVGATTLYADGTLNPTCCFNQPTISSTFLRAVGISKLLATSSRLNREEIGGWDRRTTRAVGAITGCYLLTSADLFRQVGGFDDRFFMYSEDTDFSLRLQKLSRSCVHLADVVVVHHGGRSDSIPSAKMVKVLRARGQFFRKNWSPKRASIGLRLLDLTVALRAAWAVATRRESKWRDVWRDRSQWRYS